MINLVPSTIKHTAPILSALIGNKRTYNISVEGEQLTSAVLYNEWAMKRNEPTVRIPSNLLTRANIAYAKRALRNVFDWSAVGLVAMVDRLAA